MQDQFTTDLNRLLALVDEDKPLKLKVSTGLEGALPGTKQRNCDQTRPASPLRSPYDDWTASTQDHDLSLSFAEAGRQIASCGTDASELMKLRRTLAAKLHPDVVPEAFAKQAEDLMKHLNASIASARMRT